MKHPVRKIISIMLLATLSLTFCLPVSASASLDADVIVDIGTVFDPLNHVDALKLSEAPSSVNVIYNGVPRNEDNITTEAGKGYTVVYNVTFENGSTNEYPLVVAVLSGASEPTLRGYIRFISYEHLDTLEPNSKWRSEPLKSRLENKLAISDPSDEDAEQVWHFTPEDVRAVKEWVNECEEAGITREQQNAEFFNNFGYCKTKG